MAIRTNKQVTITTIAQTVQITACVVVRRQTQRTTRFFGEATARVED